MKDSLSNVSTLSALVNWRKKLLSNVQCPSLRKGVKSLFTIVFFCLFLRQFIIVLRSNNEQDTSGDLGVKLKMLMLTPKLFFLLLSPIGLDVPILSTVSKYSLIGNQTSLILSSTLLIAFLPFQCSPF